MKHHFKIYFKRGQVGIRFNVLEDQKCKKKYTLKY